MTYSSVLGVLVALGLLGQVSAQAAPWGQCGGNGWTGPTTCQSGSTCTYSNDWYSQCIPGGPGGGGGEFPDAASPNHGSSRELLILERSDDDHGDFHENDFHHT
jgi:hypothetical protein